MNCCQSMLQSIASMLYRKYTNIVCKYCMQQYASIASCKYVAKYVPKYCCKSMNCQKLDVAGMTFIFVNVKYKARYKHSIITSSHNIPSHKYFYIFRVTLKMLTKIRTANAYFLLVTTLETTIIPLRWVSLHLNEHEAYHTQLALLLN